MTHPINNRLHLQRHAAIVCLGLCVLTGCHHKTQAAYDPSYSAPDPTPERAPSSNRATATVPRPTRIPATKPEPAPPDDLHGRPVSTEIGLASWYGPPYHNRQGADGTIFDQNALTAAHRTLPMGTMVRVTNLATNQSVIAKITDRGPFIPGRTLDLSLAAAKSIGVYRTGVAKVKIEAFAHPTADPEGRWCVQIGVFIDPDDAVQLKNDLSRRYSTAKVTEFAGPTGHWVRINPAKPDHLTAEHIAGSIHLPDAEPYVIRTN
jgi:rare lipoprotein A